MTALQAIESNAFDHDHEELCTVGIGLTDEEIEMLDWGTRGSFPQIPASGAGFTCYGPIEKRHGRSETLQAIQYICEEWAKAFPSGPRIGVGNISYAGGGPMRPHKSHQQGIDVDLRPIASTSEEIPLTWQNAKYSRQRTQQLVDLIHNNPIANVRVILFNDPNIKGVKPWEGHDNHLHVSFFLPGVKPSANSSDLLGDLQLMEPYMKGARVRQLQENLAAVGMRVKIDGVFGSDTDAAVRKFQTEHNLEVDGIAGQVTQAKLAQLVRDMGTRGGTPRGAVTLQKVMDENQAIPFDDVNSGVLVNDQDFCTEIQTILNANGLLEKVDGLYGPKTREALRRFKQSRFLGGGDVLEATTIKALLDAKPGSGQLPDWQGGDRKEAIQAIIAEAHRQGITNKAQIAYILATVKHETNDTFQPVREAYYLGDNKGERYRQTLRYYPYYGRGYVQLTWDYNYRRYSNLLSLDLMNQPDLVMRPDISLFILIDGMKRGIFTGVGLDKYISCDKADFYNARRIINGTDEANRIKGYAIAYQISLA